MGRGAGRRTPCARESCDSPSSPEPAAGLFGGADPYGVLCYVVGDRGYRERLAAPPASHRSSLRDGGVSGEREYRASRARWLLER